MNTNPQSLVIIDPSVSDYQTLIAGISPSAKIIVLDPNTDGIQQISDILNSQPEHSIDALHLVSHAGPGSLKLGNSTLNSNSLADPQIAANLQQWSKALNNDADILLYGCDLASGQTGQNFIQKLSQLTAADIAASNDKTGSPTLDGNWVLEATTGASPFPLPFQLGVLQAYNHLLSTITVTTLADEDDGSLGKGSGDSLREAINAANSTPGDDIIDLSSVNGIINLNSALPAITDNVTIQGSGKVTVSGNQKSRVFFISGGNVTLSNFNISNGNGSGRTSAGHGGGSAGMGGALFINGGNVKVDQVGFSSNRASGGNGGSNAGMAGGGGGGGFGGDSGEDSLTGGVGGSSGLLGGASGAGGTANSVNGGNGGEGAGGGGGFDDAYVQAGNGGAGGWGAGGGGGGRGGYGGEFGKGGGGNGGAGGFGGGGGGGNTGYATYGTGGPGGEFGGKGGTSDTSGTAGGGGGAGLGGAVFVRSGASLDLANVSFFYNSAAGGSGGAGSSVATNGENGLGKGGALFIDSGATVTASGPVNFNSNSARNSAGTNTDNNNIYGTLIPNVVVTPTGKPSESATTGTFTIARTTNVGSLTVNFTLAGTATPDKDYTLTGATSLSGNTGTVTIPEGATTADLTLSPKDDTEIDPGETVQLAITPNPTYNITPPGNGSLTIEDNDLGYAVTTSAATLSEGNSGSQSLTFTINRSGRTDIASTVDYTLGGTAVNNKDYNNIAGTAGTTATTGTVNFAAGETAKTITLDVLGNIIADGNRDITLTLSNPLAPGFSSTLVTPSANTTIIDDENVGISVTPTTGLTTTEAGGAASFTVVLNTQPTADVTIGLTSSNPAEGKVSANSLTFTSANWNTPQNVTVAGLDDNVADGDIAYNIVTAPATSTDAKYNNLDAADVALTNTDNDKAGITVTPTTGLTTTEAGGNATFTVVLNSQPTADVTIGLTSSNPAEGKVSSNSLIFTATNWNTPQTVTVTGLDDNVADGDIAYNIVTAPATSTDAKYNSVDAVDVALTNTDNDSSIQFSQANYKVGEDGKVQGVAITLNRTGNTSMDGSVDVLFTNGSATGGQDFNGTPQTIKFKAGETSKTVTVPIIDDKILEGTEKLTLSLVKPINSSIGTQKTANLDIIDNDTLRPNLNFLSNYKPGFLTAKATQTPLEIARNYLKQNAGKLNITTDDVDNALITDQYTTKHNGATHIYFGQQLNGLQVFNGDLNVTISKNGEVVGVGNRFGRNLGQQFDASEPTINAAAAITAAAADVGLTSAIPPQLVNSRGGRAQEATYDGSGISRDPIPVKLMYDLDDNGEAHLVWRTVINSTQSQDWWEINVDAESGEVLRKVNWNSAASERVFPLPTENPDDGSRTLVTNPENLTASPYGWHDTNGAAGAEYTDTRGNNVYTQEDADANNTGGYRPDGGASLQFDFPLDLTQNPSTYRDAAITNLFYWNNILHDIHYQYGFDEASGNFQENNYGKGGTGNDPVQADAQDGSGTNNANFATPPDGQKPRMQMYLFTTTSPKRDGDLDGTVITHEYGHGVSNRLTGGPSNSHALTSKQSKGMGEGWSDFWGLALTMKSTDTSSKKYPIGTYVLGQNINTGGGIRNYPYSTDMSVNPLTYESVKTSGGEEHNIGEAWAVTLLDLYWNFVNKYGFDPNLYTGTGGNNKVLQLVMDGLKIQPSNPSFLEARDAILQADYLNNGGVNNKMIWETFARRGMGFSASDGGSANSLNVVNGFDLPPAENHAPSLTLPLREQGLSFQNTATPGVFAFSFANNTFTDPDVGDSLSYTANWYDGVTSFKWRPTVGGDAPLPTAWSSIKPLPSGLTFNGSTRTFSMTNSLAKGKVYWINIKANDTAGASDETFFDFWNAGKGSVIDGYISGATVFLDVNKNGVLDADEPTVTTDSNGQFNLDVDFNKFDKNQNGQLDPDEGQLVANGGVDTATGLPLETPVKAPVDASVVTLLTSLVAEVIDRKIDPEEANKKVLGFLSLPSDVDLTTFDPIAGTNTGNPDGPPVLVAMTKVQNFITQTAGVIDGASNLDKKSIVDAIVKAIGDEIIAGEVLDISQADKLAKLIQKAVDYAKQQDANFNPIVDGKFITDAALVMGASNQYVDGVVAITPASSLPPELARVQKVTLDEVVKDLLAAASGKKAMSEVITEDTGAGLDAQIQKVPVSEVTDNNSGGSLVGGNIDFTTNAENQTEGTSDDDKLTGTSGDDIIVGKGGNDIITGNDGNDLLFGNADNDSLDGNDGNDTLLGGKNKDTLNGGVGDDFLFGNLGKDLLNGGDGNDKLFGNQGDDYLNGGEGNDSLYGGKGNDLVNGNAGDDLVCGDQGNDLVYGDVGNDILFGNSGLDFVDAGDGNDSLYGGKDNDTLIGGNGDDFLSGDFGNDSLIGGAGKDKFVLQSGTGSDVIADFTKGEDLLVLAGGLNFGQLTISAANNSTLISVGDELLATLNGVNSNLIGVQDFALI